MYVEFEKSNVGQKTTPPELAGKRGLGAALHALKQRFAAFRKERQTARALTHLSDRARADIGHPRPEDPADFWSPKTGGYLTVRGNR